MQLAPLSLEGLQSPVKVRSYLLEPDCQVAEKEGG